ncbi:MAG: hypothetical protein HXS41_06750 [Theionarchaea archaeon]|nr:hypothetical protein [Theionarchaea archaeon]MBU7000299.1 hypothetical protein [Theionarchaea archaeon]MBU7020740.1 hypothetical protein [Theionarchaea archaeon]MBU7034874.1 hypothetical protein [Theionarchaea archaeon]MBU7040128.1 hypothetical protein [Theionarchaea archaeon]
MSAFIELDDLRPKHTDLPMHWNDWYFTVTFSHEGKDCFLVMAITEGTFMGGSGCSIGFCQDAFSPVQEGDAQVIGEPTNHISIGKLLSQNAFTCTEENGTVIAEMDKLRAVCRVDEQEIISENETLSAHLTFNPRGPVLRWGNKKDGQCPVTEGTSVSGIESLSDVHGTITIDGKEIDITGRGVFEHVWIKTLEFMKIRTMDWTYLHFDQLYAFLCHCESISDDGTPYHFEDGLIHILGEEDCFVTRSIEFMPESWVYMKPYRRFIPSQQKVTVKTDRGVLGMRIKLSLYPKIAQAMRMEPLTMHNTTGWSVLFLDAPINMEGEFTYSDGKSVKLTSGKGVNEQLRILPL